MEAGRDFETHVFAALAAIESAAIVDTADRADAKALTAAAMERDAAVICGADLPDDITGRRTGKPDVLVRVDNSDGAPAWLPVEVKHHRLTEAAAGHSLTFTDLTEDRIDPQTATVAEGIRFRRDKLRDDALQLAHYWRMLDNGGLAPRDGTTMAGVVDRDEKLWWIDLSEPRWNLWWSEVPVSTLEWYDHEFAFRIDVIADTLRRNLDPSLKRKVVPVWTAECRACPWRGVCTSKLEADDHVSLLPGNTYDRFVRHRRLGTSTRSDVAHLDPGTAWVMQGDNSSATTVDLAEVIRTARTSPPDTTVAALAGKKRTAIQRLASVGITTAGDLTRLESATIAYQGAKVGHLPTVIDQARAAVSGHPWRARGIDAVVVPRADVEVDVDMESSEDGVYLWGAAVTDSGGTRYVPFVTWEPLTSTREAQVFSDFWAWLNRLRVDTVDAGFSFAGYHYSAAENVEMRRILGTGVAGLPDAAEVETFIASDEWIDLRPVVSKQVITGHGMGLKEVAPLAGFRWRDDDAGGDASTVWYRGAVAGAGAGAGARDASRAKLLRYNEDDVLATCALRAWLSTAELPTIDDWKSPNEPTAGLRRPTEASKRRPTSQPRRQAKEARADVAPDALVDVTKNAIRDAARKFSKAHASDKSEQASRQTFWDEFFAVFGRTRREVASFEHLAERSSTGRIGWLDLLYPGQMAVEHKSAGSDLDAALDQLHDYLHHLHRSEKPWLLVVCDFQRFRWVNLETSEEGEFALVDLADNLHLFWWIAGYDRPGDQFETQEDANLEATRLLAAVHDQLADTGYDEHALRQWITRILFCLFADDAGIWERDLLTRYLFHVTRNDGSDLGSAMALIFQVLNTPRDKRAVTLDEDLDEFAYINGDLFAETLPIPSCTESIRTALLDACRFNWARISPAIFGSLFQNVMTPKERRHLGAHYTTEQNILRTIRPLFLDDLEAELGAANTRPKLEAFHNKLGALTFFDPACGCGNFLVVTYREIRRLENDCLRQLEITGRRSRKTAIPGQRAVSLALLCKVTVDQFYGIEIEEFPALIARTALYLADHLANREVSAEFGEHYVRFPIPASPHIHIGNALRTDWNEVLPVDRADYVYGNPPFVGMSLMDDDQQSDNRAVFAGLPDAGKRTGRLDYVACWYAKSLEYGVNAKVRFGFVSTNSITQGDQARALGPLVDSRGFHIDFAHRTFAWSSEARGKAHVHVVIIGISFGPSAGGRVFDYADLHGEPTETKAASINWYLADAPSVYPGKRTTPSIAGLPRATQGSKPWDGTHLLVTEDEVASVRQDPIAARFLREYRMGYDFLNGGTRWCLWLVDASPRELRSSPVLRDRLAKVAAVRRATRTVSVQAQAATPSLFSQIRQPSSDYLAMPKVSSERRRIVPAAYLSVDVIAGDKLIVFPDAPLWLFGVLQSAMWVAWLRNVGGRLKSDLDISVDLAYNAFPFPEIDDAKRDRVEVAAQRVLDERDAYTDSLADLYDPIATPAALTAAHDRLDQAIDRLYGRHRHTGDASRLRVLFRRYAELNGGDLTLFADV
ncbi:MAG TPA: TM0106 family RecB-like putative nuclease [Microthrixaceae bacterium]|nr:TM0106 family RecB-like putative nuclease [Microthrixaceae bacterium]HMT25134.1 TM0106 family RecB-like putative nuclease [Microthrixaceae bacterium]HMT60785.1 TM0106 family RecB-like putative nuclease [Microthrixaceae bacterium]